MLPTEELPRTGTRSDPSVILEPLRALAKEVPDMGTSGALYRGARCSPTSIREVVSWLNNWLTEVGLGVRSRGLLVFRVPKGQRLIRTHETIWF